MRQCCDNCDDFFFNYLTGSTFCTLDHEISGLAICSLLIASLISLERSTRFSGVNSPPPAASSIRSGLAPNRFLDIRESQRRSSAHSGRRTAMNSATMNSMRCQRSLHEAAMGKTRHAEAMKHSDRYGHGRPQKCLQNWRYFSNTHFQPLLHTVRAPVVVLCDFGSIHSSNMLICFPVTGARGRPIPENCRSNRHYPGE